MKNNLLLLSLLVCLGCSQTEKNYVAKVKLHQLADTDIYNGDLVYDVIFDAQELAVDSLKDRSSELFRSAIDSYINKKDPAAAVPLFRRSILVLPDARTYYELGNALSDKSNPRRNYAEAMKAYAVAERLNWQPASMLHYKMAIACNMQRASDASPYETVNYLQQAFNEGFNDTAMLNGEASLRPVLSTNEFKEMFRKLDMNAIARKNTGNLFASYKNAFHVYRQPFEIGVKNVGDVDNQQRISFDFAMFIPEMQNTYFGREVSNDYFYVAQVAETPAYTALIYSSVKFYDDSNTEPVTTKIVTYDASGKIIASRIFAGQFSAEKIKAGRIDNNEITLRDYKRTWKKPIDEVPMEENEVDKYELLATSTFKLMDSGDIVEVSSVPADSKTNL